MGETIRPPRPLPPRRTGPGDGPAPRLARRPWARRESHPSNGLRYPFSGSRTGCGIERGEDAGETLIRVMTTPLFLVRHYHGHVFPRGSRSKAIVVFFVGLGLFLSGAAIIVVGALFPPASELASYGWLGALVFGFISFGFGGLLASWTLLGGRSPWRYIAATPGYVLTGFGLWLIASSSRFPGDGKVVIGALVGVLLVGLGLPIMAIPLVVHRGERAHPPQA